jgi:hypothetical protein
MQFDIWLDRVANVFAMASFIPQIDFVTLAAKELSRAPIGESRTTFFPQVWAVTTLTSAGWLCRSAS